MPYAVSHGSTRTVRAVSLLAAATFGCCALAASALAQVQDAAQQKCLNGLNKAASKVAATQVKEASRCLGAAAKGDEPDAQACLTGDGKGKVAKATAGTVAAEGTCTTAPDFGKADAATVNAAAAGEQVALVADVFGASLTHCRPSRQHPGRRRQVSGRGAEERRQTRRHPAEGVPCL